MTPERFGPYTLVVHLATGGMGELHVAQRGGVAGFSKQLVLKRLRSDLANDDEFVEMFLDEGRLAAMLDHSNIVHIYELGEVDGSFFMSMEYVHGGDLGNLLSRLRGRIDLPNALYIMRNICEGLAFAHDAIGTDGRPMQLVHRDINPQNILISNAGAVKVADFGIAKAQQSHREATRAGILKGKFGYLSPEQARGFPVDRRCDIYALGLLLFEITTGRSAIPHGTDTQMLEAAAHGMLVQPNEIDPTYPQELGRIYRKATAWRAEDRYQTVSELLEELLEFQMDGRLLTTPQRLAQLVDHHFSKELERIREAFSMLEGAPAPPPPSDAEVTRIERPRASVPKRASTPRRSNVAPARIQSSPPPSRLSPIESADTVAFIHEEGLQSASGSGRIFTAAVSGPHQPNSAAFALKREPTEAMEDQAYDLNAISTALQGPDSIPYSVDDISDIDAKTTLYQTSVHDEMLPRKGNRKERTGSRWRVLILALLIIVLAAAAGFLTRRWRLNRSDTPVRATPSATDVKGEAPPPPEIP